ncbi:MAG TPA: hypothetical protein VLB84_08855, partial [Bacteroidia bacterium]|nr:hypothetical protein [Bacteroidia bacterium]
DLDGGNIYVSELKGDEWGIPTLMEAPINSPYWEPHACLTSDNRALYFVSDRPGGFGGRDIYKCLRLPNGKWGPAQNLGERINTQYDEDGIFIHPDGKQIYFSSKGHESMGGFDIFTSKIDDENGYWSTPVNYGYPVNTPDDDVFLITSVDGKRAYFSSDKEGGFGEKDIYMIDFPEFIPRDITVLIGKIINKSGANIENNEIYIINTSTNDTIQTLNANSITGKYGANLPIGASYKIVYTLNGKEFFSEILDAPKNAGYNVINREIPYVPANDVPNPANPVIVPTSPATKTSPAQQQSDEWFKEQYDDDDDVKQKTNEKTVATVPCELDHLNFEMYFSYNQQDSDKKRAEFKHFCDNLKSCLLSNPNLVIEIEASASKVPTRKWGTNERLAKARANSAERKVQRGLANRGLDKSEVPLILPSATLVQGPEYQKDAQSNKTTYEKYQYIKIKAYIKK